jgi:hypothetical protein
MLGPKSFNGEIVEVILYKEPLSTSDTTDLLSTLRSLHGL